MHCKNNNRSIQNKWVKHRSKNKKNKKYKVGTLSRLLKKNPQSIAAGSKKHLTESTTSDVQEHE